MAEKLNPGDSFPEITLATTNGDTGADVNTNPNADANIEVCMVYVCGAHRHGLDCSGWF